jgi:alpha-tubulin suppressor-like RCC1 family protein
MMRTIAAGALAALSLTAVAASPAGAAAGPAAARSVLAWGLNDIGELGNGTVSEPGNPARVPVRTSLPPGARIRAVSAGCNMALAVTSQGQVLGWGTNRDGRLGLGPGGPRHSLVPVKVQIPAGNKITAVRAGCFHALAVTSTGKVLAWGRNIIGAVGTGRATEAPVLTPTRVHLPRGTRVTAIAASYNTSMALATSSGRSGCSCRPAPGSRAWPPGVASPWPGPPREPCSAGATTPRASSRSPLRQRRTGPGSSRRCPASG